MNIAENTLEEAWTAQTAAMDTTIDSSAMQPLIVRWHANIRASMPLSEELIEKTAFTEVIVAANDGKVYFFDLETGEATRDPIDVAVPLQGSISLYPNGLPIMFVGGANAEESGLFAYNLLTGKKICVIKGSDTTALSSDCGFMSAPLIDYSADVMLTAGNNGLFYTLTLGKTLELKGEGNNQQIDSLKIDPKLEVYRAQSAGAEDATVQTAVAAYDGYAYYATKGGVINCLDVNTLTSKWAIATGEESGVSLALDDVDGLALYASSVGTDGVSIRRINAEDGSVVWSQRFNGNNVAAPVIGENEISDLIIVTVSDGTAATVYGLRKADGGTVWTAQLSTAATSSPLALYGAVEEQAPAEEESQTASQAGSQTVQEVTSQGAWVLQGDDNGALVLLDAASGAELTRLELGTAVVGSPAAFNDAIAILTQDGVLHGVVVK